MDTTPAVIALAHRPGEVREEWTRPAPAEWERRLREFSPISTRTSHLRFRWRAEDEQWAIYQCTPATAVSADRAAQLSVHWSDLPTADQHGRRVLVTEYQFYMWQTHRLSVGLFWCLQGTEFLVGGTPATFTERERRLLSVEGQESEAFPPGVFPNIPFDERVVRAIQERDLLLKAGNDLDEMLRRQSAGELAAEDEQLEKDFRRKFLAWHHQNNAPGAEFMKWFLHTKQARQELRPGTRDDANRMTDWQDRFIETGDLGGGLPAFSRTSILVQ